MLAPVMTLREGGRIYSPGGRLLEADDRLDQPGLVAALEVVAAEGARTFYEGTLAESLLGLMEERDGLVTRGGPGRVPREWPAPAEVEYAGVRVQTRGGLSQLADTLAALPSLRGVSACRPGARPRPAARRAALQRQDVRAHHEPLRRRRRRETPA